MTEEEKDIRIKELEEFLEYVVSQGYDSPGDVERYMILSEKR